MVPPAGPPPPSIVSFGGPHAGLSSFSRPPPPISFRVTNIDIKIPNRSIYEGLQNFEPEPVWPGGAPQNMTSHDNIHRLHLGAAGDDRITAVVEFVRQPATFPRTKRLNDVYTLTTEDRRTVFKTPGKLVPQVDAHFHGLTPLSSPLNNDKNMLAPESRKRWLWFLGDSVEASLMPPIRVDIIILTPLGNHPFDFWKSETGDMWITDFLVNEGFDGARISVFGTCRGLSEDDDTEILARELFNGMKRLQVKSTLSSNYSTILVERVESPSFSNVRIEALTKEINDLYYVEHAVGHVGFVLLEDPDLPPEQSFSLDNCRRLRLPERAPMSDDNRLRFSSNGSREYRDIVRFIWDLVNELYDKGPVSQYARPIWQWWIGDPRETQGRSITKSVAEALLKDMIPEGMSRAVNNLNHKREGIGIDREFFSILHDHDFLAWLMNSDRTRGGMLRIESSSLNLTALCSSLSGYLDDHQLIHIDAGVLSKPGVFGQGVGCMDGSALLAPFILTLFSFVVEIWAVKGSTPSPEARPDAVARLLQSILRRSGAAPKGDSIEKDLQRSIENLGSSLVGTAINVLGDLKDIGVLKPMKLMIVVSGLAGFMKSPELGRLVHSIRKFHEGLSRLCVCKTLLAHKPREDLVGLLGDIAVINDDERAECLASLRNLKLGRLKPIDPRHKGTLDWFWEDEACKGWMAVDTPAILCLFGKPACGKSVLSKFVLERSGTLVDDGDTVASFFFNVDQPELRLCHTMLQKIAHDILHSNRSLFPYFQSEFRKLNAKPGDGVAGATEPANIVWGLDDLERVLRSISSHPIRERIHILVDGLDESENQMACAETLARTFLPNLDSQVRFKLFVATRQGVPIERCFKSALGIGPRRFFQITQQDRNSGDILEYTKSFLNNADAELLEWGAKDIEHCRRILVQQSCGIFLWAKLAKGLVEDYLKGRREASLIDFVEFLKGIPKDIDELYGKLLDRLVGSIEGGIEGADPKRILRVKRMFRIAAQAKRSLSVEEFLDAYVLPSPGEESAFDLAQARKTNVTQIIPSYTGNFLEVHQKESTVEMLHPTAADFLRARGAMIDGELLLEQEDDEGLLPIMAHSCLQYLRLVTFDLRGNQSSIGSTVVAHFEQFAKTINNYPFLVYALEYTKSHIKPHHISHMAELLRKMSTSPIRFLLQDWIQVQCSALGLAPPSLQKLNEQKVRTFKNCILHCAAAQGFGTAVRIAVAAGADVESHSSLHEGRENAMCLAIISTDQPESIVRILLESGASSGAPTRFKSTPLHYAGKYMKDRVVELLLRNDADVNARDSQDMTPLHRSVIGLTQVGLVGDHQDAGMTQRLVPGPPSKQASLTCVELLVRAGADLQAGDSHGRKAIHWASGLGRRDMVKFLVESAGPTDKARKKAANEKCVIQQTAPLYWASGKGHPETVKYLLNKGAQVEYVDKRGKTAVNWAARFGHSEILRDLLDALRKGKKDVKAVVDTQELGGRTALIWAAIKGNLECARLLIEAGADVNLGENVEEALGGGTPLSWSVTHQHAAIIDLLLEKGAAIDIRDERRSLLGWASSSGSIAIFEKLRSSAREQHLELDPDGPDVEGNTPFMLAAAKGHVGMLEYLYGLQRSGKAQIDVHHQNQEGNTALLLAAGWGRLPIVVWLVATAGLDIDHVNVMGDTALHRAANWGREDVVNYLLTYRARSNIRNKRGMLYTEVLVEFHRHNDRDPF
ncbi:ankyrin repeat-containing domain protein [Podospora conica]|nr:ankyrin repeat-containing domain protein [Schizothecium conicum]